CGDVTKTVAPVLEEIERRLTWKPRNGEPVESRIVKIGEALLALKELEYEHATQDGDLKTRIDKLIDQILAPIEHEWLKTKRETDIVGRVKALRAAILPDMIAEKVGE